MTLGSRLNFNRLEVRPRSTSGEFRSRVIIGSLSEVLSPIPLLLTDKRRD